MTAPITSNEPTTTRLHHYAGHYCFFAEMPLEGVCWASFVAETRLEGVCWASCFAIQQPQVPVGELCRAVTLVAGPSTGSVNRLMRS